MLGIVSRQALEIDLHLGDAIAGLLLQEMEQFDVSRLDDEITLRGKDGDV